MKTLCRVFVAIVLISCISDVGFAATEYVIANNNDSIANILTVYKLDTTNGTLAQIASLQTGGIGLGPTSNNVVDLEQAISQNASCIFAMDAGGNTDIATFSKTTEYAKVGNYSDPSLNANYLGGSLALTPNGKFLYASYSTTLNIGAWRVNDDCSLTLIASYIPSRGDEIGMPLKVSPNGKSLVATLAVAQGAPELFAIDQNQGTLSDIGYISFSCSCNVIQGLDFTRDSKFVVFANEFDNGFSYPIAMAAEVAPTGLIHPRAWTLKNSANVGGNLQPFFSAAGYAGNGYLFFGMSDGVVTANFTENPLRISVANRTSTLPVQTDATIAVTGSILVMAQYPNQISVFSINPDGSLTQLSSTRIKDDEAGLFSLSVFPTTR